MTQLTFEHVTITSLKPYERNARTHTKKQLKEIARSIREFGFRAPMLIDGDNRIIAGHARAEAAKLAGLTEVPVLRFVDMSEAQIRAYIIADNKLAEKAGWDFEILVDELKELEVLNFEIELTGFEMPEIDILFRDFGTHGPEGDPDDELDEPAEQGPAVTQLGDLWIIGSHRLLCGDATDPAAYEALLDGEQAQMVFTDPPYNVRIQGHVSGLGKVQHREFAMASGEMTVGEFTGFLAGVFTNMANASLDGAIHFICHDWRHVGEVLSAAAGPYSELKNICVWAKTNAGMGSLYRSQHEFVFVYKVGTAPHINNVELGKHGRHRSNVWTYPGANTFGKNRDAELAMHPTVKPVRLVEDAILDCSNRGGIVLDPFCGSGTTLLAADKTGRHGYGLELDPAYCDTIVRRMEARTKLSAIHAATGRSFAEIAAERAQQATDSPEPASPAKRARRPKKAG